MGRDIKTHQVHTDIKKLDKTVAGMERVKRAYVRTKDGADHRQAQDTPEEYAQDKITGSAGNAAHEMANQAKKQGGRAMNYIKEKKQIKREENSIQAELKEGRTLGEQGRSSFSPSGGEKVYQPKEQMIKTVQSQTARKKAAGESRKHLQESAERGIRTVERGGRDIKTTYQEGQAIKSTGKGTVKTAGRSVKTAQETARTTVKTTEQAAKNAYRTARASRKTAEKTAKAAKTAERTAKTAVKAAAKTAASAVKAVIAGTKALVIAIAAGGWITILILIMVLLFGAVLSMTGGDNSSTVSPVSAEVQAYEQLIRKYAKQYGIGEYVELIKAVMMQESGGQGNDPMKSSEGNFNEKYPKIPDGITDPEYSIECGVQEMKSCLASAEVISPMDMDNIKLALQGYNYGNGYIPWAKENYGGYTLANAAEFSDKMAQEKGWESYGDKQYVPHVLRYYSLGRIPNGAGDQSIVQVALAQEGNGGDVYWSWYGFHTRVSWCACFVSWCAEQCGYLESGVLPKFSLCSDGVKWFQDKGQFKDGSYVPATGDIIFFDWGDDGTIDHVGIVESVGKGNVNTVEGNSGDQVKRHSYPLGDSRIYGYGVPIYIN